MDIDKLVDFFGEKPIEIPRPRGGIYFLFSGDKLVYIGQSRNIFHRLGEHCRQNQFGLVEITNVFYVIENDTAKRTRIEAELIGTFNPKLNRQGGLFRQKVQKGTTSLRKMLKRPGLGLRLPES